MRVQRRHALGDPLKQSGVDLRTDSSRDPIVGNPSSSSDSRTSSSNATLIRSGGWFFTSAAAIASSAIARAAVRIEHRADTFAHQLTLPARCALRSVRDHPLTQPQAATHTLDDDPRNLARAVPQPLKALERDYQTEQVLIRAGPRPRPLDLIRQGLNASSSRAVATRPTRVGGPLNRRHRTRSKSPPTAAASLQQPPGSALAFKPPGPLHPFPGIPLAATLAAMVSRVSWPYPTIIDRAALKMRPRPFASRDCRSPEGHLWRGYLVFLQEAARSRVQRRAPYRWLFSNPCRAFAGREPGMSP